MPRLVALAALALVAAPLGAQQHAPGMVHTPGMAHDTPGAAVPREPGQAAFAAIAEIVAMLDADPTTDWSKVDIEALRQHLADMDDVILRSAVRASAVPGGMQFDVTGAARTADAIGRMLPAHARELAAMPRYAAHTAPIPGGIRLTVTARDPADGRTATRIRALGVAGLLAEGSHHQPHHLMMAKGEAGHH